MDSVQALVWTAHLKRTDFAIGQMEVAASAPEHRALRYVKETMSNDAAPAIERTAWRSGNGSLAPDGRLHARVAWLTNCVAPYFSPVLRTLSQRTDRLRVFVSTPMDEDRPWQADWQGLDVTVQRSWETRHSWTYKEGFTEKFVRHFPYDTLPHLRNYRPDVIVSAQLGFRTLQACAYRLLHSCRLVIWADLSEHTEREIGVARESVRRLLLSRADAVVVTGQSGFEYVKRLGVPGDRIVLAPYVADMAPFAGAPMVKTPHIARRLLFAGRMVGGKGLEAFLRVLAEWGREHPRQFCEMWLVGDGPSRKPLEATPRPPNVALRFFGNVSYGEMPSFYAAAGIFVLPTLADTWGLVVNEALATGLPFLGSTHSQAVEELVVDGWNGWTFRSDRSDELKAALERALMCPPQKLAEMSANARKSVAHLTPAFAADRFLQAMALPRCERGAKGARS